MYCKNCGKIIENEKKYCGNCGTAITVQQVETNEKLNIDASQIKKVNIMKKMNIITAIVDFMIFLFFVYMLIDAFTYSSESEGLNAGILLSPFLIILAMLFLFFAIYSIRNNEKKNISSFKSISIIEILFGLIVVPYGLPLAIFSIVKLCILSKLNKS